MQTDLVGDQFVLPAGTVTFLLTDVEGSSRLWEERPADMGAAIARHYDMLDEAIAAHGGVRPVEQGEGDSVVAAFARAGDAVRAAVAGPAGLGGGAAVAAGADGGAHGRGAAARRGQLRRPGDHPLRPAAGVRPRRTDPVVGVGGGAGGRRSRRGRAGRPGHGSPARPVPAGAGVAGGRPGSASGFPPLRSLDAVPHNLPRRVDVVRRPRAGTGHGHRAWCATSGW